MTALQGSCHCGRVMLTVPQASPYVLDCNCSICRRLGTLWGYFDPADVRIEGKQAAYQRRDQPEPPSLTFWHCPGCGCTTHWSAVDPDLQRMGVNMRLFAPDVLAAIPLRHADGASR